MKLENIPPPQWPSADTLWHSWNAKRQKAKQKLTLWRGVAAAALIIAIAGYTLHSYNKSNTSIQETTRTTTLSPIEQHAMDFIAKHCASKNISCNTPDMLQLRQDLEQSFDKLEEIDQQLQVYGNNPELIRARNRIESHQARLIKTIVQIL